MSVCVCVGMGGCVWVSCKRDVGAMYDSSSSMNVHLSDLWADVTQIDLNAAAAHNDSYQELYFLLRHLNAASPLSRLFQVCCGNLQQKDFLQSVPL